MFRCGNQVIATGIKEGLGSCVEEIREQNAEALFALPCIFMDGLGGWMGETSDCFMDNGARYWRLIDGLFGVIEEIKSPC